MKTTIPIPSQSTALSAAPDKIFSNGVPVTNGLATSATVVRMNAPMTNTEKVLVFLASAEALSMHMPVEFSDWMSRLIELDNRGDMLLLVTLNQAKQMLPASTASMPRVQAGHLLCLHAPLLSLMSTGILKPRGNCNHKAVAIHLGLYDPEVWNITFELATLIPEQSPEIRARLHELSTHLGGIPGFDGGF